MSKIVMFSVALVVVVVGVVSAGVVPVASVQPQPIPALFPPPPPFAQYINGYVKTIPTAVGTWFTDFGLAKFVVTVAVVVAVIFFAPVVLTTLFPTVFSPSLLGHPSKRSIDIDKAPVTAVYGQSVADTWFIVYKALERYAAKNKESMADCVRLSACNIAAKSQQNADSNKIHSLFNKFLDSNLINATEYIGIKSALDTGKSGGNCLQAFPTCPPSLMDPVGYLFTFWTNPKPAQS